MSALAIGAADVEAAAARIRDAVVRTPIVPVPGHDFVVKCENLQRTGSFKIRGATNAVRALAPAAVVTASSGNHGHALAAAARDAAIPATVVMPHNASTYKRDLITRLGATIVESGPETASREARVAEVAARDGSTVVPPYDHPLVMAGQGTVGLEIAADGDELVTVVVPLGGGGLLSGVATAVRARARRARIVGVEPAAADDFVRSRAALERVTVPVPDTICDGARTQVPGELTWPIVEALVDDLIAVPDDAVVDALRVLAASGLWVEPTGALAVAGARQLGLGRGTVCVVSGRNVAPSTLVALLED